MSIKYIPTVICDKCDGKKVEYVQRVYQPGPGGGRRFIQARCHGETVELPFADEAGTEVRAFSK